MTLNTPLLWIFLPAVIAVIAGVFYNRKLTRILLACLASFGLALLAAFFPENMTLSIGPLSLTFEDSMNILGRQISVVYEMLPYTALVYAATGLWSLTSGVAGVPKSFQPSCLITAALLTAASGVQPFLYAALLIETAILVSIPTLSPPGQKTHPGILRYLTLQTLAMPLILLAGWLLTGVETLPPDSPLVSQTMIFLGLGIALWLSVFPFHTWVPMISQRTAPLATSFYLFIMPITILVFVLNFLDRFTFLRESEILFSALRLMGVIVIFISGAWTAVQDDLKRAFGYAASAETGFLLLTLGMFDQGGLVWMIMLFPVRALGFWLWGYTLNLIEKYTGSLQLHADQGFARRFPILSAGLLVAQLSLAGLPLLAAFPIKMAIFTAAFEYGAGLGVSSLIGSLGLFLFTLRVLSYLVTPRDASMPIAWSFSEKPDEYIPVLLMILILLIMGLFPNTFFSNIIDILAAFNQLQ